MIIMQITSAKPLKLHYTLNKLFSIVIVKLIYISLLNLFSKYTISVFAFLSQLNPLQFHHEPIGVL